MPQVVIPSHLELKGKEYYKEMDIQTTNPLKLANYIREKIEELKYPTEVSYNIEKSPFGEGINNVKIFIATKTKEKPFWVDLLVAFLILFGFLAIFYGIVLRKIDKYIISFGISLIT